MTTFLFGNSNRRHIANPHNPGTTLCGIGGYRTAEQSVADHYSRHPTARDLEIYRLMALPLCANCHRTQEVPS